MDNNQIITPSNYYGTTGQPETPKNSRLKIIIISVVSVIALILIMVLIFVLRNNNQNSDSLPASKENSATLQIYAALPDEIALSDLEQVVKNINKNAEITLEEDYGMITLPGSDDEFVSFYYDSINNEAVEEEEETDESEEFVDEWSSTFETHPLDTAYDFIYVYGDLEGGYSLYITRTYNENSASFQYFDGSDLYDFSTKQDAINAYLAPTLD